MPAIAVFTTAYHPFLGGAEIAIQEVANRLTSQFRFFIFTARLRRDLPPREERPEGTVIRIGFGFPFDKWLLPLMGPVAFFRERTRVGMRLVWGMDVSQGSLAALLVKLLSPRTRSVFTIQYGYGGERLRRGRFGLLGVAFRCMLSRADSVTAISNYLAEEAAHFGYLRPVKLLHNGVPLEAFLRARFSPKEKSPPTIITVSRLVPKNAVDILIRALPEIRKSFSDVRCHILGSGPERSRLEELARTLGVTSAVVFFGDVPYGDVPRHLAAADVFVRPARSEGMGNAFVEALAAGLPVVGTPVEGILDVIADGKTGLFANVDDPADVAEKTIRLLRDKALSRAIADRGFAMVRERFSWDVIADGYAEVFRTALLPRILIATPMLPPDIGGPGVYAKHLAERFSAMNCPVLILRYGVIGRQGNAPATEIHTVLRTIPSWLKHFVYFFRGWQLLGRCDVAIALDPFIVGMPLALAAWFRRRPTLFRLEGDFLWEMYVERTREEVTLREFYSKVQQLNWKERIVSLLSKFLFNSLLQPSRIVFSSFWRQSIFQRRYHLLSQHVIIIPPQWPQPERGKGGRNQVLVFAGRFVRVKNIPRLIRAFLKVAGPEYRLELIGDGPERPEIEVLVRNAGGRISIVPPLPHDLLVTRIASAHAFVLPSLSEASPNVILDCIAAGTPFLLTQETGFYEALKDVGLFVDPLDEEDLAAKLRTLTDPQSYAACRARLAKFREMRTWENVADDWLNAIRNAL